MLHSDPAPPAEASPFRALFEESGVGMVISDLDGVLVRVNGAFARFVGRSVEELLGRKASDVVHPDDGPDVGRRIERLARRELSVYQSERRYLRPDGTVVWGRVCATRLSSPDCVGVVIQDIDVRKQAEEEVLRLSGRLLRLQDDERRRIARALHESAAQTVATLSMNLQRMERMGLLPQPAETLADSLELVAQASREIRTLSHLLHPPLLEEAGLASSLRWYVQGFALRSNVEVELAVSDELGRLPTELEIVLFRVAQESLTNVHRHSGSAAASVRLFRRDGEIVLEIEDRGGGLPPAAQERMRAQSPSAIGVGIAGMRERLTQLGGTLEILSSRQGTLVRARLRSGA